MPDSSEPWASEICQANPVAFAPRNCVQQFTSLVSETASQMSVCCRQIFPPEGSTGWPLAFQILIIYAIRKLIPLSAVAAGERGNFA